MAKQDAAARRNGESAHTEAGGGGGADAGTVRRLRDRGCWTEAAARLAPIATDDPIAALDLAEALIERTLHAGVGWDEAEAALRSAEAQVRSDGQRAAAACARGHLAFSATVLGERDRADEAHSALGRAAALLPPGSERRPLLDHRRGLLAHHLDAQPEAARAAYRRAYTGARAAVDTRLLADTLEQLAGLAERDGDTEGAREAYREVLRLRQELGHLVGLASALTGLARVEPEPEAAQARAEAARLVRTLGGVPIRLAAELAGKPAEGSA